MAHARVHSTNFTSGEVASRLLGRGDLTAYENGAAKLRNVLVRPTGCVDRRPGLRFVDTLPGPGRVVAFEFNTEQVYLLAFTDECLHVFMDGVRQTSIAAPWTEAQIGNLSWTQSADTLLVVHPDVRPRSITRRSHTEWQISDWQFAASSSSRIHLPHYKFASGDTQLTRSGTSGTITLTASDFLFEPAHVGTRFRFEDKEVSIEDVVNAGGIESDGRYDKASALVLESLAGTEATTKDWTEQAYSDLRGWPVTVTFHQDRLVIGGSRSLPNQLWLSRSSDLFNFNQGEGLDDEAIEFAILSDQVNAIRAVFSGRHLQVFTSGAEWMVTGDPLTPTNIQLNRQTRIGSPVDRLIPPRDVDGATMFVPRKSGQIREFLFTDVEQAYQATDLALLSEHLVNTPIDMDYDQAGRLLYVVMSDGTLGTLTIYRAEEVTAWSLQRTDGRFRSVAEVGDKVFVLVERQGHLLVEVFDEGMHIDSGLQGTDDVPKTHWTGLDHLEGRTVKVVADGAPRPDATVSNGTIVLEYAASNLQAGLGFAHVVEPLPPQISSSGNANQGLKLRPIAITFRLEDTCSLKLDLGRGVVDQPFQRFRRTGFNSAPVPFSGDKTVRTFGWQQDGARPVWRIDQDTPLPFRLLSVSTEISINE